MRPLDEASGGWVSFLSRESEVRFHPDDSFPDFNFEVGENCDLVIF